MGKSFAIEWKDCCDFAIKLIDLADRLPKVDSKKIGMMGVSRGGMMTYIAAKRSTKISAIAVVSGVSDLHKLVEYRPDMENLFVKKIPNYSTEKDKQLNDRSAIKWAGMFSKNMPILIIHGQKDNRVVVRDAQDMAAELERVGQPHKLIIYENDDHFLRKHIEEERQELVSWFKSKL